MYYINIKGNIMNLSRIIGELEFKNKIEKDFKLQENNAKTEEHRHLWYSSKQHQIRANQGYRHLIGVLEDGNKVEFTEQINNSDLKCNFNDAVYLGKGKFYSTDLSDLQK